MGTHPIFESDFDCLTEMNATRYEFQVNIFDDQLEESALCLLHTILFHRTTGKFQYQKKGEFLIGTVGFQDVHCKTISLTYVKAASDELHSTLLDYVKQFKRQHRNGGSKTINLEFFQKKRGRWPFSGEEQIPWEVWSLSFAVMDKDEKESPSESLISVMVSVAEKVNNQKTFLPKVPTHNDLALVYECSYRDVQPYLFRVQSPNGNGFSTFKKLLKDVSMS